MTERKSPASPPTSRNATSFDRLRASRIPAPRGPSEGRRALFSDEPPVRPPLGGVVLRCSRCSVRSVVTMPTAAKAMLPSIHLPLLRKDYPSWMRCPSCQRRSWMSVTLRV